MRIIHRLSYSPCTGGPSELSMERHFISHQSSVWLRQRSYNFQHVRVASWKSSGQTDLDGVALLRPTKWSCLAEQVNLRADLQGERFERDARCLWLAEEGRINCRIFSGETDGDAFSGLASSSFPRMCAIDGVAIHLKPRTECKQTIHLNRRDGAVGFRAYIERKVPILAHNVHQSVDQ